MTREAAHIEEDGVLLNLLYEDPLRFVFERISRVEGATVLDVGCGDGRLAAHLANRGARVFGFDRDKEGLRRARNLAEERRLADRCRFLAGSSPAIPIRSSSIDVCFSRSTFQYYEDRGQVLDECLRVLNPTGTLLVVENLPHNPLVGAYRIVRAHNRWNRLAFEYARTIRGYVTPAEIRLLERRFAHAEHAEFHLFRILTLGLRAHFPHSSAIRAVDESVRLFDAGILRRLRFASRVAWIVGFVGETPVPAALTAPPRDGATS